MNLYNEFDKYPANWLSNLVSAGHIPKGKVDVRSISDIRPEELKGYKQAHFFAGIGGWAYALRLAGWAEDREVWTGSCPCQPFSNAGRGKGVDDSRHLWPAFRWLIAQRRPSVMFGEQVASKLGREWLSGVRSDLEALGYKVGAADLCSASVNAPHIRQRLFWVAYAEHDGPCEQEGTEAIASEHWEDRRVHNGSCPWSEYVLIPCGDGKSRRIEPRIMPLVDGVPCRVGAIKGYGNAIVPQVAAEFIKAFMEASKMNREGLRSYVVRRSGSKLCVKQSKP